MPLTWLPRIDETRPLRPELAAPLGFWPLSQLAECADGRRCWRLCGDVAVLPCCTVHRISSPGRVRSDDRGISQMTGRSDTGLVRRPSPPLMPDRRRITYGGGLHLPRLSCRSAMVPGRHPATYALRVFSCVGRASWSPRGRPTGKDAASSSRPRRDCGQDGRPLCASATDGFLNGVIHVKPGQQAGDGKDPAHLTVRAGQRETAALRPDVPAVPDKRGEAATVSRWS
jgi:hypothetical protein